VSKTLENITEYNQEFIKNLFLKYSDKLYRFLYFKCRNKQIAEDILSETFLKVIDHISTFQGTESQLFAWMSTIAHNSLMTYFRREQKSNPNLELLENITDSTENIEELAEKNEEKVRIFLAIAQLESDQKVVIEHYYFNQLSLDEIAGLLNRSKGAVKQLLQRAYKNLEKILEKVR
jgi:RNA polymerase sigma-70 factor (ECF subfamily)